MSAPAPLRHYYAAPGEHAKLDAPCVHGRGLASRARCAKPPSDPVHLTPGDDAAQLDAIRAASPHPNPTRTPAQDERAIKRAAKRNAARWTFGTGVPTHTGPTFTERHAPDARSTPPRAG